MGIFGKKQKTAESGQDLFAEAEAVLKSIYGPNAAFREGQYQAIQA